MKRSSRAAFTLIELLIVIAIIAILASLVLAAAHSVQVKGARSRAEAEIAALGAALESYKADNGDYPSNSSGSANLVAALMNTNTPGSKIYFEFKTKLIDSGGYQDPFGNDYQYIYTNGSPNNGTNNYDLWSTAGGSTSSNSYIKNW
jgi:general secretion pathway protein G